MLLKLTNSHCGKLICLLGLKDLIVFVICILPNTVSLLRMHFGNKISFVNQNWLVFNLCGVFVNVHRWLIVIGVVNVFIMFGYNYIIIIFGIRYVTI